MQVLKRAGWESGGSQAPNVFRILSQYPQQPPPTPSFRRHSSKDEFWGSASDGAEKILPMGVRDQEHPERLVDRKDRERGFLRRQEGFCTVPCLNMRRQALSSHSLDGVKSNLC